MLLKSDDEREPDDGSVQRPCDISRPEMGTEDGTDV
jgi:hypothetical protein